MAKKKLLLISPMLHQGGFERVCVQTARLLENEYDVTILIFSDEDINYDITGLKVVNIDIPSASGRVKKLLNVLRRVVKVRDYKKTSQIDLSYSFGSTANIVNALSGRPGNTKVFTGLRSSWDLLYPGRIKMFVKKSDAVIACSKEICDILKKDYGCGSAATLYNPVDIDKITTDAEKIDSDVPGCFEDEGIKNIVLTGREDPAKGYWHMIKAFSVLIKKFPEARLVIAGSGDFERYSELAQKLGVAEYVRFTGLLLNPFPCVKGAALYVLSSNTEGYPNALIEAMALGKPCMSTDCRTGPREILLSDEEYADLSQRHPGKSCTEPVYGKYGILVPDMDPEPDLTDNITEEDTALAGYIENFLNDDALLSKYGKAAYERAVDMTPQRYKEELIKILERS